jgi:biotin carboxylase
MSACDRIVAILTEETASDPWERTHVLVEEFIPGPELALEGILHDGRLNVLAIFDKPDPMDGPYFEETYYITPSQLPPRVQEQIRKQIAAACDAYGLREGPIHAECRINDKGVWVLEVAARTIGGLCARLLRVGTGFGLEELVLTHALDRPLTPPTDRGAAGVLMIPTTSAEILRRVEGQSAARQVPFIDEVIIHIREGYELIPWPEGSSYLGFIFSRAPTPRQAEAALRAAHACLNVITAPLWKGSIANTANSNPGIAAGGVIRTYLASLNPHPR